MLISPFLKGQFHKALSVLQRDRVEARPALQRLSRSPDYDDHCISSAIP